MSSYLTLNSKSLKKTITILNENGYHTEAYNKASISKIFVIRDMINELINEKLLEIDNDTKNNIKTIIKKHCYDFTFIIFKEKYKFHNLPKNYKLINNTNLVYELSGLKDSEKICFKTIKELDKELQDSLDVLEKWAEQLT